MMEIVGAARTPPGTRLGRYQVVKHLAHGGMAEVMIARTTGIEGFERHLVIKRIRSEQARDDQYVKMFLDEARLAAALHHQNIVQVHDIGETDGEYFFAMEYIHGEDLRTVLTTLASRREQMPLAHVVTVVAAAAAGLHYAHEQRGSDRKPLGIVHRDVSPANILVGFDGGVKVVDFGIAKAALRSAETRSGTLKGKVSYMSPEQCIGTAVDRRSDVFALGVVLYELSTVRRLFKGSSDFLTMTAIVQGTIPSPSIHRRDLSKELEAIIMKALANKPEERYQSCEELRAALERFAENANLRTTNSSLAAYMRSLCGNRPEPWLNGEDGMEVPDVDFDGPGEGVVVASSEVARNLVLPEDVNRRRTSPIMKARTKAITGGQFRVPTPMPGGVPIAEGWAADPDLQTSVSGTPVAWAPEAPATTPPKSKRSWIIAAAVAMPLIGGGAFFATRGGDTTTTAATQPAPSEGPRVEIKSAPPPPPPPVEAKPVEEAKPPPTVEPVTEPKPPEPEPKLAAKPKKPAAKPVAKPLPKVESRYDPKSLFPTKK
jgi:serine/threonine protein kinase